MSGRAGPVFWTLSAAHLINDSSMYLLPAMLPLLIPSLGISLTAAGLAVGLYQVTTAVAQPILGHLADKWPLRWMAWAGLAATAIGAAGIGIAPNYWTLLLLLVVGALGTSAFHPVATASVSDMGRVRRGQLMSIYSTAGDLGLAVGPAALRFGLPIWGPAISVLLALPCLAIAAVVYAVVPPRIVRGRQPGSLGSTLAGHRLILSKLLGIATLRAWATVGLGTFLPLLVVERGHPVEDGAMALTVLLLFGSIGGLVGGFVSDRIGRDPVIVTLLLLGAPAGWLLVHGPGLWLWVGVALVGLTLNGALLALTVRAQELMPESVAMVSGLIAGVTIGMGGLAVTPLAALAEQIGIETVADICAALPLLGALIALTLHAHPSPVPGTHSMLSPSRRSD
jgi:FSR family fosmidomycin resistance protein-like MFS transporter